MTLIDYKNYLVSWIRETVLNANMKGAIVGVSGGIDSALVVNLIKEAFPNDYLGIVIPIESHESDLNDANALIDACELKCITMDLTPVYNSFTSLYSYQNKASLYNTKARLRMTQIYAMASEMNYLVVGTDNMCEWYTGYFTKHGDGGVDIAPLIHLNKADVYEMAKLYNVPESILTKSPNAGLGSNLTDEQELKVTYDEIDKYLAGEKIDSKSEDRIEWLHEISNHKRSTAVIPEKKYRS